MSAKKSIHPEEKFKADKMGSRFFKAGLGLGGVFMILSIILGMSKGDHWGRFLHAYVIAWGFVMSIAVGSLFFVLSHHLARAKWGIVLRRHAEFISSTIPWLGIVGLGFLIPLLAGNKHLYFWAESSLRSESHPLYHHMHHKFGWLSPGFFAARYVLYFAIYSGLALYFARKSAAMDHAKDDAEAWKIWDHLRVAAGPGTVIFALNTVFFATDLFMTFQPTWYSTIYSVNWYAGGMIATYCTLALLARVLQQFGKLQHSVTIEHYHDIGKYMFGWTFFWIYTAFSQFMLQWYGNMPEETVFYNYRMFSEWKWVSLAVLLGQWAFPYLCLVTRWTKRILPLLMFFAVWQLVFHWVDLYWNIMPNYHWEADKAGHLMGPLFGEPQNNKVGFHAMDVTLLLAMVGLFIAGIGKTMKGNLMPIKDPKLPEALGFENY